MFLVTCTSPSHRSPKEQEPLKPTICNTNKTEMKEIIFESKEVVPAYLKSTLYGDLYYQVGSLINKSMLFTFPFLGYRQLCSELCSASRGQKHHEAAVLAKCSVTWNLGLGSTCLKSQLLACFSIVKG